MYKSLLFFTSLLISITADAQVRYDVYNNSSMDLTVEVKGAGKQILQPNNNTHFSYENNTNPMRERAFSCKAHRSYGSVKCWLGNQVQALVEPGWGAECTVEVGRLNNNTITCKDSY